MKRRIIFFGALTIALIILGLLGSRMVLPTASPPSTAVGTRPPARSVRVRPNRKGNVSAPRPTIPHQVELVSTTGVVERRGKGMEAWTRARVGDQLGSRESIRTTQDGEATLAVGPKARLIVGQSTELAVQEVSEVIHQFRLVRGRLSADYQKEGSRRVRVESVGGEVVAQTEEGQFSVLRTETAVAVATQTGVVDLTAAGSTVKVASGQQAVALEGRPPSAPTFVPKEVLLKVADLDRKQHATPDSFTVLRGQTQPGNRVQVAGRPVAVEPDGRFSVKVALKPGTNKLRLVTEDASGRRKEKTLEYFAVRSTSSVSDVKVKWRDQGKMEVKWGRQPGGEGP